MCVPFLRDSIMALVTNSDRTIFYCVLFRSVLFCSLLSSPSSPLLFFLLFHFFLQPSQLMLILLTRTLAWKWWREAAYRLTMFAVRLSVLTRKCKKISFYLEHVGPRRLYKSSRVSLRMNSAEDIIKTLYLLPQQSFGSLATTNLDLYIRVPCKKESIAYTSNRHS